MDPLTMMFLFSVLPSIFGLGSSLVQQGHEYSAQNKLLEKQQQFQAEREDVAWERSRPGQIYQDYVDLGFNPNLAAQAVMGGNAESASTSGSPSAPTVNSAIDAISRSLGDMGTNSLDAYLKRAQADNLDANTNKTEVEAGLLPRDYQLRAMSTDAQIAVWNKSVEKMSSEIGYTDEQKKLVEQQNMYYGRMSEAQIQVYQSEVSSNIAEARLALEKINTEQKSQEVMDADIALKHAETAHEYAETELTSEKTERERIAKDFEVKIGNIPLTADGKQYVMKLANEGKYDEIQQYYDCIFMSSMNQTLGAAVGTPEKSSFSLPFGLLKGEKYDFNQIYNWKQYPIWNRF